MPGIEAHLILTSANPPAGAVVMRNHSAEPIRIWGRGNTWGDDALTFEVMPGGIVVKQMPQFYTRNVPATVTLPPGGQHRIEFDLGDGTWDTSSVQHLFGRADSSIRAVYNSGDTPEVEECQVWRGRLQTD